MNTLAQISSLDDATLDLVSGGASISLSGANVAVDASVKADASVKLDKSGLGVNLAATVGLVANLGLGKLLG